MLRHILTVAGALIVGVVGITAVQAVNSMLFPLPEGLDLTDPAMAQQVLEQVPVAAMLGVEVSYIVGSLAAGLLVGRTARRRHIALAIVVGAVFTGLNVINMMQIPHPLWMAVLTTVTFVPVAWLGCRLSVPKAAPAEA